MIEQITPSFRFTCDRCGKEQLFRAGSPIERYTVRFEKGIHDGTIKGDICDECYNDFCVLADNFFDEVNRDE